MPHNLQTTRRQRSRHAPCSTPACRCAGHSSVKCGVLPVQADLGLGSCTLCRAHALPSSPAWLSPSALVQLATPLSWPIHMPHCLQLTWDADDDTRKRALRRKVTADELKEDDFKVGWGIVERIDKCSSPAPLFVVGSKAPALALSQAGISPRLCLALPAGLPGDRQRGVWGGQRWGRRRGGRGGDSGAVPPPAAGRRRR